jgi:NAD(P)-dependent dehydrogenase (short-subunit alcohol dehydrogenase family)
LAGKVALVTGASKGIGRAYMQALADAGAIAVGIARTMGTPKPGSDPAKNTLVEVVRSVAARGGKAHAIACDIEQEADIKRAIDEIVGNFGRIDVVINNAAMFPHYETLDITVEEWTQNLNVNLLAPYLVTRHAVRHMIRQRSGSIINLTSLVAKEAPFNSPGHNGLMPYCVTKAALNRLTTFFAEEFRQYNIAVNGLSPGVVLTETFLTVAPQDAANFDKMGIAKQPTPDKLGPPLIYLAQQTAETMTGQIVHTDTFRKEWPQPA